MTSRAYEMSQSFDHDGDVTITGNTTIAGDLSFDGTGYLRIPAGTEEQKPGPSAVENGMIRYNTTVNKYEGYHDSGWLNFNDLRDKDGDTKITVHDAWGNDEDELKFFTEGVQRQIINTTSISSTTTNHTMTASHVEIAAHHTVITGNLTVQGTQTSIHSTTVAVEDKVIELSNAANKSAATADGSGIQVNDGIADHNILWNNANQRWVISNNAKIDGDLLVNGNDLTFQNGESIDNNTNNKLKFNASEGVILSGNKIFNSTGTETLELDTSDAGLTIGGALTVNGNSIKSNTVEAITLDGQNVKTSGILTVNGNSISSSTAEAIALDGANTSIKGDLTVEGNDINSSSGHAITLSGQDVTVKGNLTLGTDAIKASSGDVALTTSETNVTVGGNFKLGGNIIQSSGGQNAIQVAADATLTTVKGDLAVQGNEIKHTDGTTHTSVLTLASDNVTANKGLTIAANENFTFNGRTFANSVIFTIKGSDGVAVLSGYLLTT